MATKKKTTEETTEETSTVTEEVTTTAETTESTESTETSESTDTETETGTESTELDDTVRVRLHYIGPSLPRGLMNTGKILLGTEASIAEHLAPILAVYPQVDKLLVTTEHLAAAKQEVAKEGTLLNHYAQDVRAEARANTTTK